MLLIKTKPKSHYIYPMPAVLVLGCTPPSAVAFQGRVTEKWVKLFKKVYKTSIISSEQSMTLQSEIYSGKWFCPVFFGSNYKSFGVTSRVTNRS